MKKQKTIKYEPETVQSLKDRIERRSVVIESHNELVRMWRQENRNDYALIKKLHQMG